MKLQIASDLSLPIEVVSRQSRNLVKECLRCKASFERTIQTVKQWERSAYCHACEPYAVLNRIIAKTIETETCWLWMGYTKNGYGCLTVHDRHTYIHVFSFNFFNGELPEDSEVRHSCDIRPCWRPEHLLPGTHMENMHDAIARARNSPPPRTYGTAHHMATLTDEQCESIRTLRARGVQQRDVAKIFNCSQSTVWRITHSITRAAGQ